MTSERDDGPGVFDWPGKLVLLAATILAPGFAAGILIHNRLIAAVGIQPESAASAFLFLICTAAGMMISIWIAQYILGRVEQIE